MQLFHRLVGLETEYAMVAPRDVPTGAVGRERPPTRLRRYRALVDALARRIPIAEAHHDKPGVFAANSSAVWFETNRASIDTGLIEGATPECRGPVQAVLYQRAQDRLLAESAADADVDEAGGFQLLKNDQDARGATYGAQENYEATIAVGWRLAAWRLGLVLLLLPASLLWLHLLLVNFSLLVYVVGVHLASLVVGSTSVDRSRRLEQTLLHPDWVDGRGAETPLPPRLEALLHVLTRGAVWPLAACLQRLIRATAFVPQRRALESLLVTRLVVGGAGVLRADGSFQISDKAVAIGRLVGFGDLARDKPIFDFGYMLKAFGLQLRGAPYDYLELFARRQRLQIGVGDSNMAATAELLRVATTALVLDMVESYMESADSEPATLEPATNWPQLANPLAALQAYSADDSLTVSVKATDGRSLTAVEVQREYARRAVAFLREQNHVPGEASFVSRLWNETLDRLETNPLSLVGKLDWITKRQLLREAGAGLAWEARKKIDLRYHELSPTGYYQRLAARMRTESWIDEAHVERAMRSPPHDSPATMRGHYIREFSVGDAPVRVTWRRVVIGEGKSRRVIRLDRYQQVARLRD